MQKVVLVLLIVVCEVKGQFPGFGNTTVNLNVTTTTTSPPCLPSGGQTSDNTYAVLKRNCYYAKYSEEYFPKFYPLTKGVLYKTSQATYSCGEELSLLFYGAQVCVSFTYQEYRRGFGNIGLVFCKQKCFGNTATITERKTFGTPSHRIISESKSDLELILTPNHHGIQPTQEPCHPEVGETGSLNEAILKRTWCQSYTKKVCFTVLYPLVKGVQFKTSQANRTYGRDVSVVFYGKEVCLAYLYERFDYKLRWSLRFLQRRSSYCRKTCFTGKEWNEQEKSVGQANPTLTWKSDYELIVAKEDTGKADCKTLNLIILSLSILMSMFI